MFHLRELLHREAPEPGRLGGRATIASNIDLRNLSSSSSGRTIFGDMARLAAVVARPLVQSHFWLSALILGVPLLSAVGAFRLRPCARQLSGMLCLCGPLFTFAFTFAFWPPVVAEFSEAVLDGQDLGDGGRGPDRKKRLHVIFGWPLSFRFLLQRVYAARTRPSIPIILFPLPLEFNLHSDPVLHLFQRGEVGELPEHVFS